MTRPRVAVLTLVVALLPSCGVSGLNFKQDERVTITSPRDRAEVQLPVVVTWRVRDFDVTGRDGSARPDAGYFGMYVDRAPQPPGKTQDWLVRDDENCRNTPGCPNEEYLAQQNVFSGTEMQLEIERLPEPASEAIRRREFHEVTIVLLNGRGQRIGESAFTRQFEVDRDV